MVTIDAFRKLALSFPEATEEPHFEKTSFGVRTKIFATLAVEKKQAVLMLPPIEQPGFCGIDKAVIYPIAGTWGKNGATVFELTGVRGSIVKDALTVAYCKVAPKALSTGLREEALDAAPVHTFFATPADFRKWLTNNYTTSKELLVGFHKVGSGKPSITWPESVGQALCFGWIDGIRRNIDAHSYSIRFTPRKPKSVWSAVNIRKVGELTEQGLMLPAGLEAYAKMEVSKVYSYESMATPLTDELEQQLKANEAAWAYFQKMPASYCKPATHWVMSAKQEVTRQKRLSELISACEAGTKVKHKSY